MTAILKGDGALLEAILEKLDLTGDLTDPLVAAQKSHRLAAVRDAEGKTAIDHVLETKNGSLIRRLYQAGQVPFIDAAKYLDDITPDLKKWDAEEVKEKTSSWKLFAGVHLDHIIASSNLEGENFEPALILIAQELRKIDLPKLAEKYEQAASLNSLIDKVKSEDEAKSLSQKFAVTLANLPVGESCLIPGGWTASPPYSGHAMLYEVVREEDHSYSFYVFNSGAGLNLGHPLIIDQDLKSRYQQAIKVGKLPEETICNPSLMKSLFDLNCKKNYTTLNTPFKEQDFYHNILPDLLRKGERQAIPESEIPFSTPQRAGTCFWSSCMPHLQKELRKALGEQGYKDFRLDIKTSTLDSFASRLDADAEHIFCMEEALKNFARTALKQEETNATENPSCTEELACIERCREVIAKKTEEMKTKNLIASPSDFPKRLQRIDNQEYVSLAEAQPALLVDKARPPIFQADTPIEAKIHALNEYAKALAENKDVNERNNLEFLFAVEREFLYLPIDQLKTLNPNLFAPLVELANNVVSFTGTPTPENILTLTTLQIGAYEIACTQNNKLTKFAPTNGLLSIMKDNGYCLLKDPVLDEKKQNIISYLDNADKPKIFSYLHTPQQVITPETAVFEEDFVSAEGQKNLEEIASKLHKKYEREFTNSRGLPVLSLNDFKKACILADLGNYKILAEPLLSLKKLSTLSFSLTIKRCLHRAIHHPTA